MYEDFKFKNYWSTRHKIRELNDLINRLRGDIKFKLAKVKRLESQLETLGGLINSHPGTQLKNISSDTSITVNQAANLIIHCHNPEGKELNSIFGLVDFAYSAKIYFDGNFIAVGATDVSNHGIPISVNVNNNNESHSISVIYNGMTITQNIVINSGDTIILTFTFDRIQLPGLSSFLAASGGAYLSVYPESGFIVWIIQQALLVDSGGFVLPHFFNAGTLITQTGGFTSFSGYPWWSLGWLSGADSRYTNSYFEIYINTDVGYPRNSFYHYFFGSSVAYDAEGTAV